MATESVFLDRLALSLPGRDDDVLTAKRMLNEIGRLPEPEGGFSPLFDRDLDGAVRDLQEDNGLMVDGLITPGGPTERNIRREWGDLPAEPSLGPSDLDVEAPIGNGLINRPADIIGVSKALGRLGFFKFDKTAAPPPIITRKLVAGIEAFQRVAGLPETGEIIPGDAAQVALQAAMAGEAPLSGRATSSRLAGQTQLVDVGDIQRFIQIPEGKSELELKTEALGLNDLQNDVRKELSDVTNKLRSARRRLEELRTNPPSFIPPIPFPRFRRRRNIPGDVLSAETDIIGSEINRQTMDEHRKRIAEQESIIMNSEEHVEALEKQDREIEAQKGDLMREREALRLRKK